MYRKIVWCYIIVLALLDISLNTKLSAQGKSHGNGVSVHESLMEGISLQEWGKEAGGSGAGRGGRAAPADALALAPAALAFGRAALAAAHHRTVTVTNCGNDTIHLASVAGTTPDFHASFFHSKTLVPQANTTFSVVYLGRREGPVSTHLFIHTSRGLLRYPVSAEGVASEWRVWPLVGVRVPLNATLDPMLTVYNPTDTTIQITEVYSSGSWVQLELPEGGASAPRQLWALPPRTAHDLLRLRLLHHHPPQAAYIRIKGNMPGGGLVVAVEGVCTPAGEYLRPLQLRLRTHGARDPPHTWTLEAGNSAATGAALAGEVWGARCSPAPPDPPPSPPPPDRAPPAPHTANGGHVDSGVRLTLLREHLDAHQEPVPVAHLTLDYGALWAGADSEWLHCAGWARVGRAATPYSLRLRGGTLALTPRELHFVTASGEEALKTQEVTAHNEFEVPVHIENIEFPPEVEEYFHTESLAPVVLSRGSRAAVARLRLRAGGAASLQARVTLRTNLTDYWLPLLLYEGSLHTEWQWAGGTSRGALQLGAVSAHGTRVASLRLHNRGAAPLCVTSLHADVPGAAAHLALPDGDACVPPHRYSTATLTVTAGGTARAVEGRVVVRTAHARTEAGVALRVAAGSVVAGRVELRAAAPYVRCAAPLLLHNTMQLHMTVTRLATPPDGALEYELPEEEAARVVRAGRGAVGRLVYAAERACEPRCATGLRLDTPEGAAWLQRAALPPPHALPHDAALLAARRAAFVAASTNITAMLHTTEVVGVPVPVSVGGAWPTLVVSVGGARLAPVGGVGVARVRLRNPASTPLVLHPVLAGDIGGGSCPRGACAPEAFTLGEWRVVSGAARAWPAHPHLLLLQPAAELELAVSFTPAAAADLAACLYLRNNLTILESVPLSGRGAHPSFELGGRKPNSTTPILLEVSECGAAARTLVVRNTGAVRVRVRAWALAGGPCAARGFRLQPCAPLALAPNDSASLELAFSADWTRARAHAVLSATLATTTLHWPLLAVTPPHLLARCGAQVARPPWEPWLRAAGDAVSLVALVLVVALAVLDAERALRRHRAARAAPSSRAPLDLRALHAAPHATPHAAPAPSAPAPPLQPRRRRTPRRRAGGVDAAGERLAFERWRAGVARRAPPSSEEGEDAPAAPPPAAPPRGDASSSEPESSPSAPRKPAPRRRAPSDRREQRSSASDSSERERAERAPEQGERASEPAAPPPPRRDCSAPPDRAHAAPAHEHDATAEPPAARPAPRAAGAEGRVRTRSGGARSASRKERVARRRTRAASPPPARASGAPGAQPALRWGASWSSVVSRGAAPEPPPPAARPPAPLAPIGSHVPRRSDHSLFYYGSRAPAAPAPPPPPPPYAESGGCGACEAPRGLRALEAVWGGGGGGAGGAPPSWAWGAPPALRPPPGFAPRDYDPFHSLASIWTPAALDWRAPAPAPAPPPDDERPRD